MSDYHWNAARKADGFYEFEGDFASPTPDSKSAWDSVLIDPECQRALDSIQKSAREEGGGSKRGPKRRNDHIMLAFEPETRRYAEVTEKPELIFVVLDPDAKVFGSTLSIVSGFLSGNRAGEASDAAVILGMTLVRCDSDVEQDAVIAEHMRSIRSEPTFEDVPIIMISENRMPPFAARLERKVRDNNCTVFDEHNDAVPNTWQITFAPKDYVRNVQSMLRDGRIKFSTEWFS